MPDTAGSAARYAIVGTGARHAMFSRALSETFASTSELVALCDCNPVRLSVAAGQVAGQTGNGIATYGADEFERMIAEQRPGTVVVTVPDALHHDYIIRAMEAGCDVVTVSGCSGIPARPKAPRACRRSFAARGRAGGG